MKKIVLGALVALVFAGASVAYAETTTTSTTADQLSSLLKQIKELQDKLASLQKQQAEVRTDIKDTLILIGDLREGMTSEEVKLLQEMLAADPEVYPEGMVSGYYGPLTAKAVKKFQAKHGIEAVGAVGPKTRAKLHEVFGKGEMKCKAWGKMIAPGQLKKVSGKIEIDLSECAHVPGGIAKKLEGEWKDKVGSTTKLVIDEIEVESEDDTAEIGWETNRKTTGVVWYDTEKPIDLDDAEKESSSSLNNNHEIELEDLEEGETYYFIIVATDEDGKTATSSVRSFVAASEDDDEDEDEDEDDLVIDEVDARNISTSTAEIRWETSVEAKGVVWYGTDSDLDDAEKESASTYRLVQEVELEDLDDDTKYYFRVVATDEDGNVATSSIQSFETDED